MTKCKSCIFYEVIKEFGDAFCKNKKNPFERILTKKFNNFGCIYGVCQENEVKHDKV